MKDALGTMTRFHTYRVPDAALPHGLDRNTLRQGIEALRETEVSAGAAGKGEP
ncbi:MAG TPA: hypothetical protein VMM55_09805 [Thermohalobaculum sp.]|nr:hypothetical protein [Thermohalobaculum sp.]